uniref:Secreted protein n=2 Tax=Plectus sambesii TaxID=2011161 RepID=A0A914V2H6_9BILA
MMRVPQKLYGLRVLIGCTVLSSATIIAVLWAEESQKQKRRANVDQRLREVQQQQNMSEYESQRQRHEEYLRSVGNRPGDPVAAEK